ncbi:DTW domain-containing protein [Myxococcota bacterium]|nr:DTW domain-containing protein [Myxococcota bacterium]
MHEPTEPRAGCSRCGRPLVACYCAHVSPLPTTTRVVVLQHPREQHKAIGTARIAALCLPGLEIVVGVEFERNTRVHRLLSDPLAPPVLLYPSADARDLRADPPKGPVTLVVLDGTWSQARSLLRDNPRLQALPRVAFEPDAPSEYRIRREPHEDYVSTIEALVHALGLLEGGDPARFRALLAPFRAMVDLQVRYAAAEGEPRWRRRRRTLAPAASRLPPALLEPRLICLVGEANEWPHEKALGAPPHPHELVHCLAASLDGERGFEQLIAPRLPLSRSPMEHALLDEGELRRAPSLDHVRSTWEAFVRPDDVLCSWGHHALGLMQRDDFSLPERRIDLREVARDHLKSRSGIPEQLVERLGLPWQPKGRGRGGARLGIQLAITRWLVEEARGVTRPLEDRADQQ